MRSSAPLDAATEPGSISDAVRRFEARGYTGQFGARRGAKVICFTCRAASEAREVWLERTHRFEGVSDPGEEVLVAAVVCPRCAAKGTLVLSYGPGSSAEDAAVLLELKDRRERPLHGAGGRQP